MNYDEYVEENKQLQIEPIRPSQVLRIEDQFADEINFFMPLANGDGVISTLESVLLIKLMRIVDATYIFEFGTFKGVTTRLLLENLPDKSVTSKRIFTLDLSVLEGIEFQGGDIDLAKEALNYKRKYSTSKYKHLVKQILQDSFSFDENQYLNKFQFIFIDGNHQIKYAKSDTEKSFKMLSDSPSCIVWHDYGNPKFPELTAYLDYLATTKQIFHIQNTMLAFYLSGKNIPERNPN
jgi:predicted O-methyltransferase YrrM